MTPTPRNADVDELACRIAEAIIGIRRPAGATPERALAHLMPRDRKEFRRAAEASIAYHAELAATAASTAQPIATHLG